MCCDLLCAGAVEPEEDKPRPCLTLSPDTRSRDAELLCHHLNTEIHLRLLLHLSSFFPSMTFTLALEKLDISHIITAH